MRRLILPHVSAPQLLLLERHAWAVAAASAAHAEAARGLFADKIRAAHIIKDSGRHWRVVSNNRAQKAQGAASYFIKAVDVLNARKREFLSPAGKDYPEARSQRVKVLFSGFDDNDMACFVYPQHSSLAGQEINVPATSLPETMQKWLACGMPCDILQITADEEDAVPGGGPPADIFCDVVMPSNYVYTVEKLGIKGMYKLAYMVECDGSVTVSDNVQTGDKIKVVVRSDGTASFSGKV
jgi:translation elongation factor P/translation initiation factor 5A